MPMNGKGKGRGFGGPGFAGPGFEWFVAWRHLRDAERKSHRTLIVGVTLLAVAAACFIAEHLIMKARPHGTWFLRAAILVDNLKMIGVVAAVVGLLGTILGGLFSAFTVFTAFSMFGVLLGTGAPIIALSIMSGFELDLKSKIRATKADVVIGRADDQPFTDWREVQARITGRPGVVDTMAYVESEVIVKHVSNAAGMGIILRGIESARASRVLDLARTLKEGGVEYLVHPERIPADGRMAAPSTWDEKLVGKGKGKGKGEGEGTVPAPSVDSGDVG